MATNPLFQSNDFLTQLTSRTVEAFSLLADANQKVLRELVDLSASSAKGACGSTPRCSPRRRRR